MNVSVNNARANVGKPDNKERHGEKYMGDGDGGSTRSGIVFYL